jgi:hypothetical protein
LSLVQYFSGTIGFCLAGPRLPHAAYYFAISVIPASLIGQGILVFIAPIARRSSIGTNEKDIIPFCAGALVAAVIVLGVLVLTAPGVHFTFPVIDHHLYMASTMIVGTGRFDATKLWRDLRVKNHYV